MVCVKHTIGSKSFWTHPMELLCYVGHVDSRFKWKHILVLSEIVLILMQRACTVCVEHTIGSEIILDAPHGPPWWRGSSERSVRLEIVLILTQNRCMVCVKSTISSNIILDAPDRTPTDVDHMESHFFPFGDSVKSVQDRCIVCAKRTIGSGIILDAPDGPPRWRGSIESSVHLDKVQILTQDRCMVCVERTIGSEIIFDAPDGTPRWRGSSGISLLSV
jgi:hypothetical protein